MDIILSRICWVTIGCSFAFGYVLIGFRVDFKFNFQVLVGAFRFKLIFLSLTQVQFDEFLFSGSHYVWIGFEPTGTISVSGWYVSTKIVLSFSDWFRVR